METMKKILVCMVVLFACVSWANGALVFSEDWQGETVGDDAGQLTSWNKAWGSMPVDRGNIIDTSGDLEYQMHAGDYGSIGYNGVLTNLLSLGGENQYRAEADLQVATPAGSDYVVLNTRTFDSSDAATGGYRLFIQAGWPNNFIYLERLGTLPGTYTKIGAASAFFSNATAGQPTIQEILGDDTWSCADETRYGLVVDYAANEISVTVNGFDVLTVAEASPFGLASVKLEIANYGSGNVDWDNVSLETIPEPATIALLSGGLLMALKRSRKS